MHMAPWLFRAQSPIYKSCIPRIVSTSGANLQLKQTTHLVIPPLVLCFRYLTNLRLRKAWFPWKEERASPIDIKSREDNFGGTRERLLISSANWILGYLRIQSSHAHFPILVEEKKWRPSLPSHFCVKCVAILERLLLTRYFIINAGMNLLFKKIHYIIKLTNCGMRFKKLW